MAYLNLWKDEYDELDGVSKHTDTHQSRIDSEAITTFIDEAEDITSVSDTATNSFEFVAGHPHSNGALRLTIRLHASVEQAGGIVNVSAQIDQLPDDACQAEAIVRALKSELQDQGCSRFEVSGRPGDRGANISSCLFP